MRQTARAHICRNSIEDKFEYFGTRYGRRAHFAIEVNLLHRHCPIDFRWLKIVQQSENTGRCIAVASLAKS